MSSSADGEGAQRTFVAGVDGCKTGWVVVLLDLSTGVIVARTVGTFAEILAMREAPVAIAIDVPIGLLDSAVKGGRDCDRLARGLLGHPRRNSVFSAPVRPALASTSFSDACAANRASSGCQIGITQQAFGLFPKLREVDCAMTAALQARVFEVHPELCFYEMASAGPARHAKKTAAGRLERAELLKAVGLVGSNTKLRGAAPDDVYDAFAACWTARRIHSGEALRLPSTPPVDRVGLRMELWR